MTALPYYHLEGRFGETNLLDAPVFLHNVVIGGGNVEGPTNTTLFLVAVDPVSASLHQQGGLAVTLDIEANDGKVFSGTSPLADFFALDETIYVPFLVFGTGCDELQVRAELSGARPKSVVDVTVPFVCRE